MLMSGINKCFKIGLFYTGWFIDKTITCLCFLWSFLVLISNWMQGTKFNPITRKHSGECDGDILWINITINVAILAFLFFNFKFWEFMKWFWLILLIILIIIFPFMYYKVKEGEDE